MEAVEQTRAQEQAGAQDQIQRLAATHAAQLREASEALEAQLASRQNALEESTARQREAERKARVESFQQRAMRRMANVAIAGAFGRWIEQYEEAAYERRLLRGAANALRRPELTRSFNDWRGDWEEARRRGEAARLKDVESGRARLEEELARARREITEIREVAEAEKAALRAKLDALDGGKEAREKELEAALERQREARIKSLANSSVRRLMAQGLSRGWQAWVETHQGQMHTKRLLALATARLARPALAACLTRWRGEWEAALEFERSAGWQQRIEREAALRAEVEAELSKVRVALEEALKVKESLVKLAMAKDDGRKKLEEQLEKEREARVEDVANVALKRFVQMELARGWSAWVEVWREDREQRRLLRTAAARLMRPQLAACVSRWRRDWEAAALSRAAMSLEERVAHEIERRKAAEERATRIQQELEAAHDAMQASASFEDAERQRLQQQIEREREERVKGLADVSLKRIRQQGMARGWSAWVEVWREDREQRRLLRTAAARLMRPQLAACVTLWKRDWQEEVRRTQATSASQRLDAEAAAREAAEMALAEATAEYEKRLATAAWEKGELEKRLVQLEVGMSESEAERAKLADERERAQQAVREGALRRFLQQGLSRGWQAWRATYVDEREQRRLLRTAAARLMRPQLAACVTLWRRDWEETRLSAERSKVQSELDAKDALARQLEEELMEARSTAETAMAERAKVEEKHGSILAKDDEREFELRRGDKERQRLDAELALERVALADERKKTLSLLERLEELGSKVSASSETERLAKLERHRAEAEAKRARERLEVLENATGGIDPRQAAEERLAKLLAEQRETLELAQKQFRQESAKQLGELRTDKKRLEQRIAELEARLKTWTPPRESFTHPPEAEKRDLAPSAVTQFKAFTFSSDKRAEERRRRAEEEAKIAAEAERLAEQERMRVMVARFNHAASLGTWFARKGKKRDPPKDLSPELKRQWRKSYEENLGVWAATKLQAVYRGKLARARAREGGGGGAHSPGRSPPGSPQLGKAQELSVTVSPGKRSPSRED